MQDVLDTTTAGLAALTLAIVAAVRKQIPAIDGPWALLVALVVATGLVLLTTPVTDWRAFATRVGFVFAAAVGTHTLAGNVVDKVVDKAKAPSAPPTPLPPTP